MHLESLSLSPATINLRLAKLRKLATEAAENGWMHPTVAAGIARVRGGEAPRHPGGEVGDGEEVTALLKAPDGTA